MRARHRCIFAAMRSLARRNGSARWSGKPLAGLDLVATVGKIDAHPGAGNVIAGRAALSLDVRHVDDGVRTGAVARLLACAQQIAARRGLSCHV